MRKHTPEKDQRKHPLSGRKLYIPRMSVGAARTMAAAFQSLGIDAQPSPESDEQTLTLAAKVTTGEECLPQRVVLGNFLKVITASDFLPAETAFFLPTSSGPCRFGQYAPFLKKLLREWEYEECVVFSPTSSNQYEGISENTNAFLRVGWRAVLVSDILRKLMLMIRPYEKVNGTTDRVHMESLDEVCEILSDGTCSLKMQMKLLTGQLEHIRDRFKKIDLKEPLGSRPLIGAVGEIFLRFNSFSNQQIVRRIETAGGEVWIADIAEWVWYTHWEVKRKLRERGKRFSTDMLMAGLREWVQHQDEKALLVPFRTVFQKREELKIEQVLQYSTPYLPPEKSLGEMTVNAGKTIGFYHAGCDGLVDISPFTCMNGIVTEAVYPVISRDHDDFPIRMFYFDGVPFDLDTDLEIFMELVKSYRLKRLGKRG